MKKAIIELSNNSKIEVKTAKSFDIKCSHTHFSFLQANKNFQKVSDLLDNHYFQKYANNSIFPFLGAKIISVSNIDGRRKDSKKLPYFCLQMLIN